MEMNINRFSRFVLSIVLILFISAPAGAEYIFLKDGAIVEGRIIGETSSTVTLLLSDGKRMRYSRGNIMRTLYTNLYMGKVFVHKTDGKVIEAYMVDEDQESYTFRMFLYKPEEFFIKRNEVLFIARKNPTGLTGKADTESIEIKWRPPYNPVEHYNVYIKTSGKEEYKMAGETGDKDFTIKGLKSNTTYFIIVTAVDEENYESLPSNEIKIKTLNIPPENPKNIITKMLPVAGGKSIKINLKWESVHDPDGKIKAYRVFIQTKEGYKLIGETKSTEYTTDTLVKDRDYFFHVRSVDDSGDESKDSGLASTLQFPGTLFSIRTGSIMPMGDFSKMLEPGYGAVFSLMLKDLFLRNLDTGLEAGFFLFPGKDENVENSQMIPLLLTLNYRFFITKTIVITPLIGAGYSFNKIKYRNMESAPGETEFTEQKAFEPVAKGGIFLYYLINTSIILQAGAEYASIFEKRGRMEFLTFNAGVGIGF